MSFENGGLFLEILTGRCTPVVLCNRYLTGSKKFYGNILSEGTGTRLLVKELIFHIFKLSDKIFHLGVLMDLGGRHEYSVTASIFDS